MLPDLPTGVGALRADGCRPDRGSVRDDVTVIIPAYTDARWGLTCAAVASVLKQSVMPREIVVCVDHNPRLFRRFADHFRSQRDSVPQISVIESRYDGHVSASRTTGIEYASTEFVVFLDDDAEAEPEWLAVMLRTLTRPGVVAVGGAPHPVYGSRRPRWLPEEFNWIFGCAYKGLPTEAAPMYRMIGSTFAARRADLIAVGGFAFDVFEDMDISHKLLSAFPDHKLMYEPAARVRHFVDRDRLSCQYFVRRIFWVNRGKVAVMQGLAEAGNFRAERQFVRNALTVGMLDGIREFVRGDWAALARSLACICGIAIAAFGYSVGAVEAHVARAFGRGISAKREGKRS